MRPHEDRSTPSATRLGSLPGSHSAWLFAVVFLAYAAGAVASAVAFGSTTASAFFFPAGITVAALLLTRRSLWPVIVGAIVLAELIVDRFSGLTWAVSAGFALGNAVEALVGAVLVAAWCGGTPDLRRTKHLAFYVLGAAGVGALCGGLIGGLTRSRAFGVPLGDAVTQWFAGDAISVLVVGTSILLWSKQSHILRSRPVETLAILAAAGPLAVVGFETTIPPGTTVLPILAVAALRLGVLGTALTGTVVAVIGNYLTGLHHGLIGGADTTDPIKVASAQIFVAVLVLSAMVIAQEVAKRTSAVRERDVERGERLRLESLADLGRQLTAALTPHDVARVLERSLPEDLGTTAFSLGLVSYDRSRLEWVAAVGDSPPVATGSSGGPPLSDPGIATQAVRSARPVMVTGESAVAWPLFAGNGVTGVLLLGRAEPQPFDAEQFTYLSAVAVMVGEALVRAQSYSDEHARAAALHSALHPASRPLASGAEYCVAYEPADLVHGLGGDFYDVMPLPKDRTYVAVGDIVGHGLPAVEDMAQLRSAGRALAHRGQSPAQILADLNEFADDVLQSQFATMVVAVLDHAAGLLTYCSAGHPPAFLRRAQTGQVIKLADGNGPVLGPLRDPGYEDEVIRIDDGDTLVMYTDGLVERAGAPVSEGISRAQQVLAEWPEQRLLDCRAFADTLVPPPRSDDVCVLVVRFD